MNEEQKQQHVNMVAQALLYADRSPILHRPDEYGLEFEEVWFHAMDGTVLEGWFIPADSDKVIIANHFGGANRAGFPGHLEPWNYVGFEIDFIPYYKALHDAGYNVLAYDMRGHGLSAPGPYPISGLGQMEYRDVIGSIRYIRSREDTAGMKIALHSVCMGAVSTLVALNKHPEEFEGIKCMILNQPLSGRPFVEANVVDAGIENGIEMFDEAFRRLTSRKILDFDCPEFAKAVKTPTMLVQVHDDIMTKPYDMQNTFDAIPIEDKKLHWIQGTTVRHDAYRFFSETPEPAIEWFDSHM